MKVLVIGSDRTKAGTVDTVLDRCWSTWGAFEVGTAGGWRVEERVSRWAERQGARWWPAELIPALLPEDWADVLVAFDGDHSPRTRVLARRMRSRGKPVHQYGAREVSDG